MNLRTPTPRVGTFDHDEHTSHAAGDCFTVPGVEPIIEELIRRIQPPGLVWLISEAATPANAYELTRRAYQVAAPWPAYAEGDQHGHPIVGFAYLLEHQRKRLFRDEPPPEARAAIFCRTEPLDYISDLDVLMRYATRGLEPPHLAVGIQAPLPPQANGVHFDPKDPRMWITSARETVQQLRSSFGPATGIEVRPARHTRLRPATHWLLVWHEFPVPTSHW